jgi:hypothetical protein
MAKTTRMAKTTTTTRTEAEMASSPNSSPRVVRRRPGSRTFESLDQVLARHISDEEELPAPAAAAAPVLPPGAPPMSRLSQKIEIQGEEAVPSDDPPHRRPHATMSGQVEEADDAPAPPADWDGQFRTLEDLLWRFPIGDGSRQYYLHVTRVKPTLFDGKQIHGVLRPTYDRISHGDFVEIYGGGIYNLMVYGPPARRNLLNHATSTGAPRPRPMLKSPVTYTVPWDIDAGGYPPNVDAAWVHDEFGETGEMLNTRSFQRPPGSADAAIHRTNLEHKERRELRDQERREREREQRKLEANGAISAIREAHQESVQVLREQLQEKEQRPRGGDGSLSGLAEVMSAIRPTEELAKTREQHASDLKEQERRHREDLASLRAEHERERSAWQVERQGFETKLASFEERLERRERDAVERGERLAKEAREDAHRRVRDADEVAQRRVTAAEETSRREIESLRGEHLRQLEHQKSVFEMRLGDAERERTRAIEARDIAHRATETALRSTAETAHALTTNEIDRLKTEILDLKRQLAEKEDLPGQVERFAATASVLGFAKSEGEGEAEKPDRWQMLAAIGQQLAASLPDLAAKIAEAASARRAPQQQQLHPGQPPQMRQLPHGPPPMPPPRRPLPFATEDATMGSMPPAFVPPPHQVAAPPPPPAPPVHQVAPQMPMAAPAHFDERFQHEPRHAEPPPARLSAPPPMAPPETVGGGVELPRAPVAPRKKRRPEGERTPRPAPVAAVPQAPPPAPLLTDEQILARRKDLEQAYNTGQTPEQVGQLIALSSGSALPAIVQSVHPQRIMDVILRSEGGELSPLVRVSGQRWLGEIHAVLQRVLAQQS